MNSMPTPRLVIAAQAATWAATDILQQFRDEPAGLPTRFAGDVIEALTEALDIAITYELEALISANYPISIAECARLENLQAAIARWAVA